MTAMGVAARTERAAAVMLIAVAGWLAGLFPALAGTAPPPCRVMEHEGLAHTVCEAAAQADLRLFLTAPDGLPFATFSRIDAVLAEEGLRLVFAMNAGMYHPDRRPVGLHVEDGRTISPIVTAAGPGNFGMLPNGVFCRTGDRFAVIESRRFASEAPPCDLATQSGPMLLIEGALHPRFLPDSTSRFIRNGVGVSPDGHRAWFVISQGRVNFDEFARFFRDALGVRDALYFDGNVSRLHAPSIGRADFGRPMGPVVGLVGAGG